MHVAHPQMRGLRYGARVDGLQADARYCFVLAAANAVGTGRWSRPSCYFYQLLLLLLLLRLLRLLRLLLLGPDRPVP